MKRETTTNYWIKIQTHLLRRNVNISRGLKFNVNIGRRVLGVLVGLPVSRSTGNRSYFFLLTLESSDSLNRTQFFLYSHDTDPEFGSRVWGFVHNKRNGSKKRGFHNDE